MRSIWWSAVFRSKCHFLALHERIRAFHEGVACTNLGDMAMSPAHPPLQGAASSRGICDIGRTALCPVEALNFVKVIRGVCINEREHTSDSYKDILRKYCDL